MATSVGFYSPKFWLLRIPLPGTFEWSRAITFLQQSAAPFDLAAVAEPAMRWRILPALAAHILHLGSSAAWAVPHLGLAALLWVIGIWVARTTGDRVLGLLTTMLAATSGGIITINILLGISDAWFLLGLLTVVFSPSSLALACAGALCPWVDERFLIALPLALFCRHRLIGAGCNRREIYALAPGVLGYLTLRIVALLSGGDSASSAFLGTALATLQVSLPYAPLGWWMGFRASWLLVLASLWLTKGQNYRPQPLLGSGLAAATLLLITLLAADTTRSTSLLLPVLVAAPAALARHYSRETVRNTLAAVLSLNLLIPFAWVTYNKLWLVFPLPIEVLRTLKNS
jgi:hypothetical protein